MKYQCAVLGDITLDRFLLLSHIPIIPSPDNPGNFVLNLELGKKIPVSSISELIGGNAYNVAYGLNLLQIHSALVSSVGTDELSQYIVDVITEANIGTEYIITTEGSGVNQSTILSISGERIILSHHKPKDYSAITIPDTEWLYITSLSDGSDTLLESVIAQENRYKIAFNPGSYLLKHHLNLIHTLLPKTELIFVNKEEAQYITNSPDEELIPQLIHSLHNLGVNVIGLTDGNNGAYVSTGETILYLPSRQVKLVETTGAGDAFNAAFLAAFIKSGDISQALTWGVAQSSSVLQELGSVNGLVSENELMAIAQPLDPEKL